MILAKDDCKDSTDFVGISPNLQSQTTPNVRPKRPLVYVTRRIPQVGVEILLKTCNVKQWDAEHAVPRGELLFSVAGVNGILCNQSDLIDAQVLNSAGRQLQVVATTSHSAKHIDMEECHKRGIQVITCPNQPIDLLAELTIALILLTIKESQTKEEMLQMCKCQPPDLISSDLNSFNNFALTNMGPRLVKRLFDEQLAFEWTNGKSRNTECLTWKNIARKTFGVYGLTKFGISVVNTLKTISVCDVLVADNDVSLENFSENLSEAGCKFVSLNELLEKSDVLCVCETAGENFQELFSLDSFKSMKRDSILVVPLSQETTINYLDLYIALREGQILAAGLNDCNQEAVPFKTFLLGLNNCTFLPQTQESVYDMRHIVSVLIARNLTKALKQKANV